MLELVKALASMECLVCRTMMDLHHGEGAAEEVGLAACVCFVWLMAVEVGVQAWLVLYELSQSGSTRPDEARD